MKSKAPSFTASTAVLTVPWPGEDHHRQRRVLLLEPLQHLEPVELRHAHVEEHEVGRLLLGELQPDRAVRRLQRLVALVLEDHLERGAHGVLVVDDQHARLHGRRST